MHLMQKKNTSLIHKFIFFFSTFSFKKNRPSLNSIKNYDFQDTQFFIVQFPSNRVLK